MSSVSRCLKCHPVCFGCTTHGDCASQRGKYTILVLYCNLALFILLANFILRLSRGGTNYTTNPVINLRQYF